jgi:hypothetical protein
MHVLVTHQLSYALVARDLAGRERLLESTGHGYLRQLPVLLVSLAVVLFVGLGIEVVRSRRAGTDTRAPAWPFAALAPACFAVQEHVERIVQDGGFPAGAWHERTFVLGLALQAPIALLAWLVARLLLRAAPRIAALMQGQPAAPPDVPPLAVRPVTRVAGSRRSALATCSAGRAPPGLRLA